VPAEDRFDVVLIATGSRPFPLGVPDAGGPGATFTEGFATPDMIDAEALLDSMAPDGAGGRPAYPAGGRSDGAP
jgi:hypothetical protein